MSNNYNLGARLREVMKKRRISANTLGRKLGISRNRINAILNDELTPNYFTMKALRRALDIDTAEAMGVFFPNDIHSSESRSGYF